MFGIRLELIQENIEKLNDCRSRIKLEYQRLQEVEKSLQTLTQLEGVIKTLQDTRETLEEQSNSLARLTYGLEQIMNFYTKAENKAGELSEGIIDTQMQPQIGIQEVTWIDNMIPELNVQFRE